MEKISIDSLLTWEDVFNLGNPCDTTLALGPEELKKDFCKSNYNKKLFDENFKKYIISEFAKLGQPTDVYESRCYTVTNSVPYADLGFFTTVKSDENRICLGLSKIAFFLELVRCHIVASNTGSLLDPKEMQRQMDEEYAAFFDKAVASKNDAELKEVIVAQLKEFKLRYIRDINLLEGISSNSDIPEIRNMNSSMRKDIVDTTRAFRNVISWYIKNIDTVFEFLDREYPIELINTFNKDKFLLSTCLYANKNVSQEIGPNLDELEKAFEENDDPKLKRMANYLNNYALITDYIEKENDSTYEEKINYTDDDGKMYNLSTGYFKSLLSIIKEHVSEDYFDYNNVEDLLKDKAPETWRKLRNKQIAKNITVKFDMITPGTKADYVMDRPSSRVYSKSEIRQAQIEEDYRKLEDKLDYYKQKEKDGEIALNLFGINNFVGYFAKFMKNGCVVLDKYYTYGKDRRGQDKKMPAHSEGIYIMNYEEFADLCRCNKQELIDEVRDNNPNIIRKYHSGNWRKNVDEILEGPGFGGIDYDLLDDIVKGLEIKSI